MQQISGNDDRPNRRSLTIITEGATIIKKLTVCTRLCIRTLHIGRIYTVTCARDSRIHIPDECTRACCKGGVYWWSGGRWRAGRTSHDPHATEPNRHRQHYHPCGIDYRIIPRFESHNVRGTSNLRSLEINPSVSAVTTHSCPPRWWISWTRKRPSEWI